MAQTYIGTSGWQYDGWKGPFYPEDLSKKGFLDYYADVFPAVEVNNTFYSLPEKKTLKRWREHVPKDFIFACKGSRYVTHMKKLKDPKESTKRLFKAIEALGQQLGPVLFQLPPNWKANVERLETFMKALRPSHRYVFEFRDGSWFTDDVYDVLEKHGAAFCIYNMGKTSSPVEVTADFVYIRLHGPVGKYQGSYDDNTLEDWAKEIRKWRKDGKDVYCFFDNDQNANAPNDAQRLKEML